MKISNLIKEIIKMVPTNKKNNNSVIYFVQLNDPFSAKIEHCKNTFVTNICPYLQLCVSFFTQTYDMIAIIFTLALNFNNYIFFYFP